MIKHTWNRIPALHVIILAWVCKQWCVSTQYLAISPIRRTAISRLFTVQCSRVPVFSLWFSLDGVRTRAQNNPTTPSRCVCRWTSCSGTRGSPKLRCDIILIQPRGQQTVRDHWVLLALCRASKVFAPSSQSRRDRKRSERANE